MAELMSQDGASRMGQITLTLCGVPGDSIDSYRCTIDSLCLLIYFPTTWICRIFLKNLDFRIFESYPSVSC